MTDPAAFRPRDWNLHASLPATLPEGEIRALHETADNASPPERYAWNGWRFDLGDGVFIPGPASEIAHECLLDETIPVAGRAYAAMGVGLGVELVVAAERGASMVCGIDIHAASVRTAASNYERIIGPTGPPLIELVSDLWDVVPAGLQFDVVTFNPPFSEIEVADPEVRRMRAGGLRLAERFLNQTAVGGMLAPGARIYLTLANTEPMREIVAIALHRGFSVEAIAERAEPDSPVRTSLLALAVGDRPHTVCP